MKAIRVSQFGPPSVLEYQEIPDPAPAAGQILVRLHAAGVNPVDAYIRGGKYPRLPALPFTPGHDGAGVVEQSDVPSFPAGTRVYVAGSVTGTYAELAVCAPAQVQPLPEHVSFDQGAGLGIPYGTASWALFHRGGARRGETVLVHGASGGVGLAGAQLARGAGLRVIGTAGTAEGMELVRQTGAEAVFNHRAPNYLTQLMAATNGRGFDIILEMAAHENLGKDLTLLAPQGRVMIIGSRGTVEIDPRNLMARSADARGVTLFSAPPELVYPPITAGLEDRSLNPVIGHAFPLGDAAMAHEKIMSGGARGKIILTM